MTRTLSPNENQGIAGPPIGWVPPADGAVDCSIYLFESGVITDAGRMFGATLGTIVLGIAEQGLGHVRRHNPIFFWGPEWSPKAFEDRFGPSKFGEVSWSTPASYETSDSTDA